MGATLDDIFKCDAVQFPVKRMRNLFRLVGDAIVRAVQAKVDAAGLWALPPAAAEKEVDRAGEVLAGWRATTKRLSREWNWRENPEEPRLRALQARVGQIRALRRTQAAMEELLSPEEVAGMQVGREALAGFAELRPLHVSPHADALWARAVSDFDRRMEPAEGAVLERLRESFGQRLLPALQAALNNVPGAAAQPFQLLRQFLKHRELLARPGIARRLEPQREQLLKLLSSYMVKTREAGQHADALVDGRGPEEFAGRNFSGRVNTMVFTAQLHYKVVQVVEAARPLVADLSGFDAFMALAKETKQELEDARERELNDWQRTTLAEIKDKESPLRLDLAEKAMSFDGGGRLKVHFDERLVELVRDVRQFRALGCKIPREVDAEVAKAQRFYHSATVLRQVANVYNTMESSMIECQLPMLLDEAKAFEDVVAGGELPWQDDKSDPGRLERYIESVDGAMQALRDKNRRLRKVHETNAELVVKLMNTDLVRQLDRWKDILAEMRGNIDAVESEVGGTATGWRTHWNYQLAKALEFQYKLGLESCHENLSPMTVKLVFKDKRLCFDPPFEEIRRSYYGELKKFIMLPSKFTGVSKDPKDDREIFKGILDRNSKGLSVVFSQAEKLFRRLAEVADKYEKWVALGSVDVHAVVEEALHDVEDWEHNFRLRQTRERDASKLDALEKAPRLPAPAPAPAPPPCQTRTARWV